MALLSKKTLIGIKSETTTGQGTAETLDVTDYILAMDVDVKPNIEIHERDYNRNSFDRLAHVIGKKFSTIKFKTEIKGSGTAGTAYTPFGAALLACGFKATTVASTSVTYSPETAIPSNHYGLATACTIIVFKDGLKHICAGSLGNVKFSFEAGKIAFAEFDFTGLYSAVTLTTNPTPTFNSTLPAIVASALATVVDGSSYIVSKMDIDCGNSIQPRDDVNSSGGLLGYILTGRNPKGSVSFESDSVAPWTALVAGTEGSSDIKVSGSAGNIVTFTTPKTQYQDVSYADQGGIIQYNSSLAFNQNSGNDWLSIAFT